MERENLKADIVTHYDVHNHGALLQLNALKAVLLENGIDASAVSFDKDLRYVDAFTQNKYKFSIKSISYYICYLFKKGIRKTLFNYKKHYILSNYKKQNSLISGSYQNSKSNIVIIGSDEVFSTAVGISKEFFAIDAPNKRIISYAASFGPTQYKDLELKNEISYIMSGLKNFNAFSVRDFNSSSILNKLGFKCNIVCDPVILYGYKCEMEKIKIKKRQPYILIYSYDNNMNGDGVKEVKLFAKEKGLKIYSVGFFHKWCDKNINCSPLELLTYFKNAKFVITDTFHGSVISIITNALFVTKISSNSQKVEWLLKEYNLSNRIIQSWQDLEKLHNEKIDFEQVNNIVEKNRIMSLKWLLENINE